MKRYSTDLREAAVHALGTGAAAVEVARLCGVHERTITRWRARLAVTGSVAPLPRSGGAPKLSPAALGFLQQRVARHPDATLNDHRAAVEREWGIAVSEATMSRTMHKLGITHKKRV